MLHDLFAEAVVLEIEGNKYTDQEYDEKVNDIVDQYAQNIKDLLIKAMGHE